MDYCETNQGTRIRLCLAYEEIQMPAIDELCNKYIEWLELAKDLKGGRTTRSSNKKADLIYDEIMNFKLPPIKLQPQTSPTLKNSAQPSSVRSSANTSEAYSSIDSDSDISTSRPVTRSLRSRSRTPTVQNNNTTTNNNNNNNNNNRQQSRPITSPSTPLAHHKIRAYMKKPPSGGNDCGAGSSVLSAALNQQHPSVSVTKIRQLLRADSAQKKRDEEKERQERMMVDRKNKEERAEAQKKQILEERAVNAKLKREQRLLHAAEVRKAREEAKQAQKMKEAEAKKTALAHPIPEAHHKGHGAPVMACPTTSNVTTTTCTTTSATIVTTPTVNAISITCSTSSTSHHNQLTTNGSSPPPKDKPSKHKHQESKSKAAVAPEKPASPPPVPKEMQQNKQLNGTFRKPSGDANNIDISCQDESTNETNEKVPTTAVWARAPHFREFLIKQFSKPDSERYKEVTNIFPRVTLPVDLEKIFGSRQAVSSRYMCRTSSAVWSPPHRPMKRTSSMVMTPNNNEKR